MFLKVYKLLLLLRKLEYNHAIQREMYNLKKVNISSNAHINSEVNVD